MLRTISSLLLHSIALLVRFLLPPKWSAFSAQQCWQNWFPPVVAPTCPSAASAPQLCLRTQNVYCWSPGISAQSDIQRWNSPAIISVQSWLEMTPGTVLPRPFKRLYLYSCYLHFITSLNYQWSYYCKYTVETMRSAMYALQNSLNDSQETKRGQTSLVWTTPLGL